MIKVSSKENETIPASPESVETLMLMASDMRAADVAKINSFMDIPASFWFVLLNSDDASDFIIFSMELL